MCETNNDTDIWIFKNAIKQLENVSGQGTSLITLLISPSTQMNLVCNRMNQELGKAPNIKDKNNQKSVTEGLRSILNELKQYRKTPENGLVVLYGPPSVDSSKPKLLTLCPPKPIHHDLYHCDTKYKLDSLDMLGSDMPSIGFIIIDKHQLSMYIIKGTSKKLMLNKHVEMPRKHNNGGQSAQRYERIRQGAHKQYANNIIDFASQVYIDTESHQPIIQHLVIGATAQLRQDIVANGDFDPRLLKIKIADIQIAYAGEQGLTETIEKAGESLNDFQLSNQRKHVTKFLQCVAKDDPLIYYGKVDNMINAIADGAMSKVLISETHPLLEQIIILCQRSNTKVYIIGDMCTETKQWNVAWGGLTGHLRYPLPLDDDFDDNDSDDSNDNPIMDVDF